MPKNKGKGGKNRRRGKNEKDGLTRELIEKEGKDQAYAQVVKMLGSGRLTAFGFDGKTRLCHIRGKLRKKMWIGTGDIVLLGLRPYQDHKADIILKYTPDEARILKAKGELPDSARLNELGDEHNEGEVEFVDAGNAELIDNEVGAQNRDYQLFSSSSSDSESDDNEETEEESTEEPEPAKETKASKPPVKDESSASESDEAENAEIIIQREEYKKPSARGTRGKGRRGK